MYLMPNCSKRQMEPFIVVIKLLEQSLCFPGDWTILCHLQKEVGEEATGKVPYYYEGRSIISRKSPIKSLKMYQSLCYLHYKIFVYIQVKT